tara:strand:- start:193 stop:576 length:384 start_codon:yes stop_codon:yes gene_type:complete
VASVSNSLKTFVILFIHLWGFLELQMLHSGNSEFTTSKVKRMTYLRVVEVKEKRMLRQLFKSMVVARQASAAIEALKYMTDRDLEDIGFTRATYVEQIKARVLAELDAADAQESALAPVNPNLIGAV